MGYPFINGIEDNRMTELIGWEFEHERQSVGTTQFDWVYWHKDYDGTNGLCGLGSSKQDCIDQIKVMDKQIIAGCFYAHKDDYNRPE